MMNLMFVGSISLQYLKGAGYIPTAAGVGAPLIGTWWTEISSNYSTHPNSYVMGQVNPLTYIISQVNSIALHVSFELAFQSLEPLGEDKIE